MWTQWRVANWWPLFAWPRAARGISASQSVALKVGTVTSGTVTPGTGTGTSNGTVNSTGTDTGTYTDNGVVACLVP